MDSGPTSVAGVRPWPVLSRSASVGTGATLSPLGSVFGGVVADLTPACLLSNDPTCKRGRYFSRMCALWYFQNCLDASLPATRWRTKESCQVLDQTLFRASGCIYAAPRHAGRPSGAAALLFRPPVASVSSRYHCIAEWSGHGYVVPGCSSRKLVRSYTSPSTTIQRLSALLCFCTSARVKVGGMLSSWDGDIDEACEQRWWTVVSRLLSRVLGTAAISGSVSLSHASAHDRSRIPYVTQPMPQTAVLICLLSGGIVLISDQTYCDDLKYGTETCGASCHDAVDA